MFLGWYSYFIPDQYVIWLFYHRFMRADPSHYDP